MMGARERAKSRSSKKGSGKSSTNSSKHFRTPQNHNAVRDWQSFASTPYSSSPHNMNGFSMAQEARNTERHGFTWGNARLRGNAVAFVSAGNLVREEPQSSRPDSPKAADAPAKSDEESTAESSPVRNSTFDAAAEARVNPELSEPRINKEEPTSIPPTGDESSSESDEVVFQGRNSSAKPVNRLAAGKNQPAECGRPQENGHQSRAAPRIDSPKTVPVINQQSESPRIDFVPSRPRRRWEMRYSRQQEIEKDEEEIMQDYIDNMALDDDDDAEDADQPPPKPSRRNEHFRYHKGSGEQNAKVQLLAVQETKRTKKTVLREETDEWESADLDDLNDLSTTDDDVAEVGRVLRHRQRGEGKQYLVTAVDSQIDEAKWVAHSKLVSSTATTQIQIYEELLQTRLQESAEVSSSEDEELEDLIDDVGSEEDENERIIQQTSRLSDEQIARALAKQEELGMGGDELLIFDGKDADDLDDEDDIDLDEFMNGDDFIPFSMSQHTSNRGRSKRNRRGRDTFPSAAAFADALDQDPYGGFDVMDFDRPSLRPKRKGRKSDFPYDLEDLDEELAQQLMNTWTKDREKKATRKQEKMAIREAELIESAQGSDPAVIKARIRQFLVSEADTLELTPMDAPLRASVHRLAKSLNMKSKSHGKDGNGSGRYPVLSKTPYTPQYTVETVEEVDALMNLRKFFPKHLYKGFKSARAGGAPTRRHDRGGVAAASYANGEVVGAAAPEIGQDNKGRAMLEKMGWSAGMGIGKEGNKGSIDAIKHVVKTGKAGLG